MEAGFFHPDRGYWQGPECAPEDLPSGTKIVPLIPGPDNEWRWTGTAWVQVPPDPADLAARFRAQRTALLSQSDWTQVADAPVNQEAWAEYRQALRDLPDRLDFPMTIDWPVPPST